VVTIILSQVQLSFSRHTCAGRTLATPPPPPPPPPPPHPHNPPPPPPPNPHNSPPHPQHRGLATIAFALSRKDRFFCQAESACTERSRPKTFNTPQSISMPPSPSPSPRWGMTGQSFSWFFVQTVSLRKCSCPFNGSINDFSLDDQARGCFCRVLFSGGWARLANAFRVFFGDDCLRFFFFLGWMDGWRFPYNGIYPFSRSNRFQL